jgi:hypothetical protein
MSGLESFALGMRRLRQHRPRLPERLAGPPCRRREPRTEYRTDCHAIFLMLAGSDPVRLKQVTMEPRE